MIRPKIVALKIPSSPPRKSHGRQQTTYELRGGQVERRDGDDHATGNADEIRIDRELRQHYKEAEHARQHEVFDRSDAERAVSVDLLVNFHAAQFGGEPRRCGPP
jgi:hypothetical protein